MIHRITATNFLSWKELDFSVKSGITLIDGWNADDKTSEGSGKSAILNALTWCLYGKIPKDAKIDDVIKTGEKSCKARVYIGENEYIERSRKPNDLVISKEGKEIRGKDMKETQALIEVTLGLSFETFCQTIYFAQNYDKKFITSNQEEKAKILSEVQNLEVFDKARREVLKLIKVTDEGIVDLEHKLELTKTNIGHLESQINREHEIIEQAKKAKNQQLQDLKQRAGDTAIEYKRLSGKITGLKYLIESSESQDVSELEAQLEPLRSARAAVQHKLSDIETAKSKYDFANKQLKILENKLEKKVPELHDLRAFLKNPSKTCPTCGSKSKITDLSEIEDNISNTQAEMLDIEAQIEILKKETAGERPQAETLIQKKTLVNEKISVLTDQIQKANESNKKIATRETELSLLEEQLIDKRKTIVKLKKQFSALKTAPLESVDEEAIGHLKKCLEDANATFGVHSNILANKITERQRLETLKRGFKDVKSYVFNSVLSEINTRVAQYIAQLFEVPVKVKFINDNMKIETEIIYDGESRGLGLLSGGQFRRVSLAVDLALSDVISRRNINNINLLIFDESMKDLSETSMEKCLNLLKLRKTPVLLIEHNSIFKNAIDQRFLVTLSEGTSHAEA